MTFGLALLERLDGDVVLSPYGLARALRIIPEAGVPDVPDVPGILSAQAAWLASGYRPGPKLTLDPGPLDLDAINAWSNEHTRGMIPRILEALDDDEIFVLTDAEYLDAKWQVPFEDTFPAPFEGAGDVSMMSVDGTFDYGDGAIRLPYREHDLRFVAMLGEWREVSWSRGYGEVRLPRFTTTSSLELDRLLGISGISLDGLIEGPDETVLGRVLQRARVDVDEEGTRAAATTAVTARAVAYVEPTFKIVFDRPFTWAVEHAPSGTLLFVGRVRNPTERSD